MPEVVATLSESKPGAIAIRTRRSASARLAGESPGPSAPSKSAARGGGTSSPSSSASRAGVSAITM